jgi:dUTP pyrophosphatase
MKKVQPIQQHRRVARVYETSEQRCLITKQEYDGDVGYDLAASKYSMLLANHEWHEIQTGVHVSPPPGFWFELCGRSSSLMRGIIVARGIIDAGYRGPLVILAKNDTGRTIHISPGERIAQIIAHPVINMDWQRVLSPADLGESERGDNGFGSTGNS